MQPLQLHQCEPAKTQSAINPSPNSKIDIETQSQITQSDRLLEPRHARLAVATAVAFIDFITETHQQREGTK